MKKGKGVLSLILTVMVLFVGLMPMPQAAESQGSDATLSDISFDNHSVFDFDPVKDYYIVQQPYRYARGGNVFPDVPVEAIPTDPNAEVKISRGLDDYGNTVVQIKVTAADSSTTKDYWLVVSKIGTNKYKNPGFEEEDISKDWRTYGPGSISKSTDESFAGNYSMHMTGSSGWYYPGVISPLGIYTNKTYFASMAVKTTSKTVSPKDIFVPSANDYVVENKYMKEDGTDTSGFLDADADGWRRYFRTLSFNKNGDPDANVSQLFSTSADSGSYTGIDAYYDEFYLGDLVVADVNVAGKNLLAYGEAEEIQYSAELLNQFGNKAGLLNETVTWHLIGEPEGVNIDATGKLSVPATLAKGSEFYVEAQVEPSFRGAVQSKTGRRIKVGIPPEGATAELSDIEVNGGSIPGFTSATTDYEIIVPYLYMANDFNSFEMPTVAATAIEKGAAIKVTYPDKAEDGRKIYIDVTDTTGLLKNRYTLTIKTVGKNMYQDGGFEKDGLDNYLVKGWSISTSTREIAEDSTAAGNKVLKCDISKDANGMTNTLIYYGNINYGDKAIILSQNKTYVHGFAVKNEPETAVSDLDCRVQSFSGWVALAAGAADYDKNGQLSNTITPDDTWQTHLKIFSIKDASVTFGSAIGPAAANSSTKFRLNDMYVSELVISSVNVKDGNGKSTSDMFIPSDNTTISLSAAALNQYGNSAGLDSISAPITWILVGTHRGVTVDSSTGAVTVAPDAEPGTVIVEATAMPSYAGHAQTAVSRRYKLELHPENSVKYTQNGVAKENICSGEITCTLNYTNTASDPESLIFISALYEVSGGVSELIDVKYNEYSAESYKTITPSDKLTVPGDEKTCVIKSYLWNSDGSLMPIMGNGVLD